MWSIDSLQERIAAFIPVLLSLTVHEWAHAWAATRLGDDTARLQGRLSLNPIDHIDPIGTLLLPLMGVPFGWAKPVPINPLRFRTTVSMPMGVLLTAAAGPISNLILAGLSALGLAALATAYGPALQSSFYPGLGAVVELLRWVVIINLLLAVFNLLPIPPLDGSRIVDALVPDGLRPLWNRFSAMAPIVLMVVILLPALLHSSLLAGPAGLAAKLVEWITGRG